jgi:hypothetical protein
MIYFENEVIDYLNNLVFELYDNEYFGFIDSSEIFADKLIDFIFDSISIFPARKTPIEIQYLGSNYIFYKSNQRTTWYIFFDMENDNYLITNIINNNSKEVKFL